MLEGIEIVNQYTIQEYTIQGSTFTPICILFLVLTIVAFIIASIGVIIRVLPMIVFGSTLVMLFISASLYTSPQTQIYEVTLSNKISYVEFVDKYEVISQRGKIYTIKERK